MVGLDWIGLDQVGLDWIGLDKTGPNQIRLDRQVGSDCIGLRPEWAGLGWT